VFSISEKITRGAALSEPKQPFSLQLHHHTFGVRMPPAGKTGHICPPSTATHPSDRWETMFVYSFILRFTQLHGKVEGLETPMEYVSLFLASSHAMLMARRRATSLENALLSHEPNPILTRILGQFILNLRPQTRNLRQVHVTAHPKRAACLTPLVVRTRSQPRSRMCSPNTSSRPRERYSGRMIYR
jgi:hypothetical protein